MDTIYPSVESSMFTPSSHVKEQIDIALNKARVDEMIKQRSALEKDLSHYKKCRTYWGRFDSTVKVVGTVTTFSTAISASVLALVAAPYLIPGILSGVSVINTTLSEVIIVGLTSKKKRLFRDKCLLIQGYLDKMYVYMERCKGDNVISIDEIEGFHKLMEEYLSEMNHLKMSASDSKYIRIEKEAQRMAQQELKKELLQKYKERAIQDLRSKLV